MWEKKMQLLHKIHLSIRSAKDERTKGGELCIGCNFHILCKGIWRGSIFAKLSNFSENGAGSKRNCTRENEAKVLLTDRTWTFLEPPLRCPDTIFSWYVVSGHIRFVSWSLRGKNISQKSPVFLLPICLPCHHSYVLWKLLDRYEI